MLRPALAAACLAALVLAPLAAPLAEPPELPELGLTDLILPPLPDPSVGGRWSEPFDGEVAAVSMAVLETGEVLYWSGADTSHSLVLSPIVDTPRKALARVLDLSGGAPVIRIPTPEDGGPEDIFCAGQAFLGDGRLLIAGGTRYATLAESGGLHLYGVDQALGFDAPTRSFEGLADMAFWRWYPTVLPLHDGGAMAVGGTADLFNGGNVRTAERYDAARDAWTSLPASAENLLPLYPHVFEVPTGPFAGDIAYVPGGCTSCTSDDTPMWDLVQTLDPATQTWTVHTGAVQPALDYSANVLLPLKGPDYRTRVLTVGGAHDLMASLDAPLATPLAVLTDFGANPPTVQVATPMGSSRWYPNAVLLPTGEVLAVGGKQTGVKETRFTPPDMTPELYDPDATGPNGLPGAWRSLTKMELPLGYHSTAILLPDGRVLTGGHVPLGVVASSVVGINERGLELFEPPYLFHGPRPTIAAAPGEVRLGATFAVATPDVAAITKAVLMRPGATTHTVDTGQRLVELAIEGRGTAALTLRAPPDAFIAPPGPWMLFLLQDNGQGPVPSVAHWLRVAA